MRDVQDILVSRHHRREGTWLQEADVFVARDVKVASQTLRVAVKRGRHPTPLLIFNGIGANLELLEGIATAPPEIEVIAFDVPGVGGSPLPRRPYRLSTLARLADAMLTTLGYRSVVDVLGVSWGGALAQQFVRSHSHRCRRLVLAATAAGAVMLPGRWSALLALMTPRRYTDAARGAQDLRGRASPGSGVSSSRRSSSPAGTIRSCISRMRRSCTG